MSFMDARGDEPQEPGFLTTENAGFVGVRPCGSNRSARTFAITLAACAALCAAWFLTRNKTVDGATNAPAAITVDYPLNGSIFPPDMEAPTFEWHDAAESAARWQIEISFSDGSPALRVSSKGEGLTIGAIDERCISRTTSCLR